MCRRPVVLPKPHGVNEKVCAANTYRRDSKQRIGEIWINEFIQIMKEKTAPIWLDSRTSFQPVLQIGQWTHPGECLNQNRPA